jgi:glycosyltransferase involved in cell wall biosynthesis
VRIFTPSGIFHPDSGGPATYLHRLLPELQARGHEVRVLCYGDAPTGGYPYPVRRVPFGGPPVLGTLKRWRTFARAYHQRAAWADLVYINALGLPRGRPTGKPAVIKIVGDYAWERSVNRGLIAPHEDIDAFQTRRYNPLVEYYKAARAREARRADRIIVPSQYLRDMVIGWGADPARVQVIYNALEAEAVGLTQAEARARLGWAADKRYLLTAARLTAWKGVDHTLEALARLREGVLDDVRLVVAGDGPELPALRAQAERLNLTGRVTFAGKVGRELIPLYMRAADYFLLYSGYEGLAHTVLEALSTGTPVIASARGGNPEVVRHEVSGLLIDHPDVTALAEGLRYAFSGAVRARLAANVHVGLERFSWPALVEQTEQVLRQAAQA